MTAHKGMFWQVFQPAPEKKHQHLVIAGLPASPGIYSVEVHLGLLILYKPLSRLTAWQAPDRRAENPEGKNMACQDGGVLRGTVRRTQNCVGPLSEAPRGQCTSTKFPSFAALLVMPSTTARKLVQKAAKPTSQQANSGKNTKQKAKQTENYGPRGNLRLLPRLRLCVSSLTCILVGNERRLNQIRRT